jgi:hypothetical protein
MKTERDCPTFPSKTAGMFNDQYYERQKERAGLEDPEDFVPELPPGIRRAIIFPYIDAEETDRMILEGRIDGQEKGGRTTRAAPGVSGAPQMGTRDNQHTRKHGHTIGTF